MFTTHLLGRSKPNQYTSKHVVQVPFRALPGGSKLSRLPSSLEIDSSCAMAVSLAGKTAIITGAGSGISPLQPHMPQRIAIKKVVQEAISPSRAPSSTENATSFFLTSPCGPKQKDSSPTTAPTLEATRAEGELMPKSGGLICRNRLVMEQEAGACT